MAFRNRQVADEARIDALEDEVEAKDEEIARLKAELAERNKPKPKKKPKKSQKKKSDATPIARGEGSVAFDTHDPKTLKIAMGVLAALAIVIVGMAATGTPPITLALIGFCFGLPFVFLLHRCRISVDGAAGVITRFDWWLFVPLRRRYQVEGRKIEVVSFPKTPKNGKTWWQGRAQIDGKTIWTGKRAKVETQAREAAGCLGVQFDKRNASSKEIEKEATKPLLYTYAIAAVAAAVVFLVQWLMAE